MTWDHAREWIWHVLHDPLRENPWSAVTAVGLALTGGGLLLIVGSATERVVRRMLFRRRKDTPMAVEPKPQDGQIKTDIQAAEPWPPINWEQQPPSAAEDGYVPEPDESGIHALPEPDRELGVRIPCTQCGGFGYVLKSENDLLTESLDAIPGDGKTPDGLVAEFYRRLLDAAPDLAGLFPADLLSARAGDPDSRGAGQRDKLLKALLALTTLYDTRNPSGLERLDKALAEYGRHHAVFAFPDGTEYLPTVADYTAVGNVLIATLRDAAGPAWLPEYDTVWAKAYDHAARKMIRAADEWIEQGHTMPRYPRGMHE